MGRMTDYMDITPDYPFYRCLDCDEEFEDPDYIEEHEDHPEVEGPNRETWYYPACPSCGSTYVEGGYRCEWCDVRWASIDYCQSCVEMITDEVSAFGRRYGHSYETTLDFVEAFVKKHW